MNLPTRVDEVKIVQARLKTFDMVDGGGEEKGGVLVVEGGRGVQRCLLFFGSKIVFTNGSQDPWRHASKQTSSTDMPSYTVTCHNCGHGTDLRGCPQAPLVPEGDAKNCSSPDAVHKVRQQLIEQIDLWLSQCQSLGRISM
ncbi:hypothetical protein RHGRI_030585 [Rhododendron griersonianum]|uniref:Uncharacterized protein n=1 Tax=Rhododendron griersonianum TaxID=479676 RepID=A0AAV6IT36_9ERIC|nr:hypothetical protein RHGRI_030585 [Rhododendron griersonianum]